VSGRGVPSRQKNKFRRVSARIRFAAVLAGCALLALLWRLAVAREIADGAFAGSVFHPSRATDLATYMELGRLVAEGKFTGPFYYQPFYYAVFLPFCRFFGSSVWIVIAAQAVLGALAVALTGVTAARLAGRRAGGLAALLTALLTPLVFYTPFHQIANVQTFHLALLAFCAVAAAKRGGWFRYLALGAVAGMAVLTRGNVLLVAVPLFLLLAAQVGRRISCFRAAAALLLMAGTMLAVEAPFILYNSRALGRLAGPSTAADAVLALGNTPEAPPGGRDPGLPAGPMEYPQSYHEWMATVKEKPVIRRIGEWLVREPAAFLELTFRKLLLFWDHREIPNNVALAGEGTSSRLLRYTIPTGAVLALGLAGMLFGLGAMFRKHSWSMATLYLLVIFYWGGTAAFYNLERFRAPILPVLAVFAGVFAVRVWRGRRNSWKRLAALAALTVAVFAVFGSYEFYRQKLEARALRLARPEGTILRLNNGKTTCFYHGPMTFGGWEAVEAPAFRRFRVEFPRIAENGQTPAREQAQWELEMPVQAARRGVLRMEINGAPRRIDFAGPEYRQCKLSFPAPPIGNAVEIAITVNTAEAVLIADHQRDYGRSQLDGRPMPAELVMRLTR